MDLYVSSIRYVYLVKVVFGGASVHMFGVLRKGRGGGLYSGKRHLLNVVCVIINLNCMREVFHFSGP